MPLINNYQAVIDLSIWEQLAPPLAIGSVGTCLTNDLRGTDGWIYMLLSATGFWRYSIKFNAWEILPSPPGGTVGAGTAMVYDPSRGSLWALIAAATAPTWQEFTIATQTWAAKATTNLPGTFGTDASLAHTCSAYNVAGNDDFIYLVGNGLTTVYRYSISGNTWIATLAAAPATIGIGAYLEWLPGWNTDRLIAMRGVATSTAYYYSIAGDTWTTLTWLPGLETFGTGSNYISRALGPKLMLWRDNTVRIFQADVSAGTITLDPYVTSLLFTPSTGVVGNRLCYVKDSVSGIEFLYSVPSSLAQFIRTPLIY